MHNIMLDLETMGNGPRAAIVSIGAVFFDPLTGELGAEFEAAIDLRSSAKYGVIDPDTVLWWLRQGDEARAGITQGEQFLLPDALCNLYRWVFTCSTEPEVTMWGNGAGFDNVILRSAYQATNLVEPWLHWNDRDVRTIVDLGRTLLGFDPKKELPFEGVRHSALADAKHQARYVSAIYQRLAGQVPDHLGDDTNMDSVSRITKPARVGDMGFGTGVRVSSVIEAAYLEANPSLSAVDRKAAWMQLIDAINADKPIGGEA